MFCLLGIRPRLIWTEVVSVLRGLGRREVDDGPVVEEVLVGHVGAENFISLLPIPDLIQKQVSSRPTRITNR